MPPVTRLQGRFAGEAQVQGGACSGLTDTFQLSVTDNNGLTSGTYVFGQSGSGTTTGTFNAGT